MSRPGLEPIDVRAMALAIAGHYHAADDVTLAAGRAWYPEAGRRAAKLGREHGATKARAAGVIAALSPRLAWRLNLRYAGWVLHGDAAPVLGGSLAKARAIAAGGRPLDILSGPKTRAFYRAIMGDAESVCVDVWAARAAGLELTGGSLTPVQYHATAAAYAACAAAIGDIGPRDLQAVVWCHVRGAAD